MTYLKQFEFEYWSNHLILESIKAMPARDERILLLFSHLLSSHSMWLSRVNKTEMTCTLFQERSLEECEQLMKENLQGWKEFLQRTSDKDLETEIEFLAAWEANPGKRTMRIDDAIIHLINHSSYHRGQIVARMKGQLDELPLSTYIMFASKKIE